MTTVTLTPGGYVRGLRVGKFLRPDDLPGTSAARYNALSRAAHNGELLKVRKGLYYKGKPSDFGPVGPSSEAIALEVLGKRGVGPAGYSAARAFNLTTQVPARLELAAVMAPPERLRNVRVHKRNNLRRANLKYLEVALLEVLRNPELWVEGGWPALVSATAESVASGALRWRVLSAAAAAERSTKVRSGFDRLTRDAGVSA